MYCHVLTCHFQIVENGRSRQIELSYHAKVDERFKTAEYVECLATATVNDPRTLLHAQKGGNLKRSRHILSLLLSSFWPEDSLYRFPPWRASITRHRGTVTRRSQRDRNGPDKEAAHLRLRRQQQIHLGTVAPRGLPDGKQVIQQLCLPQNLFPRRTQIHHRPAQIREGGSKAMHHLMLLRKLTRKNYVGQETVISTILIKIRRSGGLFEKGYEIFLGN